jgi:hypothetical protein
VAAAREPHLCAVLCFPCLSFGWLLFNFLASAGAAWLIRRDENKDITDI